MFLLISHEVESNQIVSGGARKKKERGSSDY
jgi:hypothetical protein